MATGSKKYNGGSTVRRSSASGNSRKSTGKSTGQKSSPRSRSTSAASRTGSRKSTAGSRTGTGKKTAASSAGTRRSTSARGRSNYYREEPNEKLRNELLLLLLFAAMAFLFLSNFGIMGSVGNILSGALFGLFGFSAYFMPVAAFGLTLFGYFFREKESTPSKIGAMLGLILVFGVLCELIGVDLSSQPNYQLIEIYQRSSQGRSGGGVLAGSIAFLLYKLLRTIGTVLMLIVMTLVCVIVITERSLLEMIKDGFVDRDPYERWQDEEDAYEEEMQEPEQEAQEESIPFEEGYQAYKRSRQERKMRKEEEARQRIMEKERERSLAQKQRAMEKEAKENNRILRMDHKATGITPNTLLTEEMDQSWEQPGMQSGTQSEMQAGMQQGMQPEAAQGIAQEDIQQSGAETQEAGFGSYRATDPFTAQPAARTESPEMSPSGKRERSGAFEPDVPIMQMKESTKDVSAVEGGLRDELHEITVNDLAFQAMQTPVTPLPVTATPFAGIGVVRPGEAAPDYTSNAFAQRIIHQGYVESAESEKAEDGLQDHGLTYESVLAQIQSHGLDEETEQQEVSQDSSKEEHSISVEEWNRADSEAMGFAGSDYVSAFSAPQSQQNAPSYGYETDSFRRDVMTQPDPVSPYDAGAQYAATSQVQAASAPQPVNSQPAYPSEPVVSSQGVQSVYSGVPSQQAAPDRQTAPFQSALQPGDNRTINQTQSAGSQAINQIQPTVDQAVTQTQPTINRAVTQTQPTINQAVTQTQPTINQAVTQTQPAMTATAKQIRPEELEQIAVHRDDPREHKTAPAANRSLGEVLQRKYQLPPTSLLKKVEVKKNPESEKELKETAIRLQETLRTFGVNVTITDISQGPTVTRYELQPEVGVKVSRIVSLQDDIKLNLAATDIRIEAPIPGKAAIGIEVPNRENTTVSFRELVESEEFQKSQSRLSFAVGKDIGGKTVVTDIAKMPHLLIAGSTGSGKSVCINTLIMSILYKAKPEEVKLIMVDPKVVELSVYNGIPHLLIPVVTDPRKAAAALNWAVAEMDRRYGLIAKAGSRDVKGYNEAARKDPSGEMEILPQIVIVVDELADLMMVAANDVEKAICRLAQLARAAGLHLIIATQRPSVDVITGLIKANMPSRIAFAVSSGVDSRTILDMNGAEKLLGKGDMLFAPQSYPKPARIQGAFISDQEVGNVVEFLAKENKDAGQPNEIEKAIESIASGNTGVENGAAPGSRDDSRDEHFAEAGRFIIEKDKASIGMLQRYYKIGFNRAARIMDQLCEAGVVSAEEGTKPRKVLMSIEEFEAFLESEEA